MALQIDIVIDLPSDADYCSATVAAMEHAIARVGADAATRIVRTDAIDAEYLVSRPDAVVMGPGTPYQVPASAERDIRSARERGVPLVGT